MPKSVAFSLNGRRVRVTVEPDEPLLYVLRNQFELNGPKFGCGLAQCGSCTVLVDGEPARSCVVPAAALDGATVTTVEGLGTARKPHPLQVAFIAEQAAQCGYCISGMIVSAAALLRKKPHPSDAEIKRALDGNLCRCGTHLRIVRAVKRAARESNPT